ncbi:MAG TPA: hypothetical protein VFW22_02765 [Pseudolabrys sp.]|nr:hypothetical protein [Pseudolabrys sp.]
MFSSFTAPAGRFLAVTTIALWAASAVAAPVGPFAGLGGVWSGRGQIHLANGSKESLRCRATYHVDADGKTMHQMLRCSSDSANFELRSDVESQGDQISGNWSELTRSLSGRLTGQARRGRIDVRVQSDIFNAEVTLVSAGDRQTVTISSPGSQISSVAISLRRG